MIPSKIRDIFDHRCSILERQCNTIVVIIALFFIFIHRILKQAISVRKGIRLPSSLRWIIRRELVLVSDYNQCLNITAQQLIRWNTSCLVEDDDSLCNRLIVAKGEFIELIFNILHFWYWQSMRRPSG